jgi:serine/threonine-protein kinase
LDEKDSGGRDERLCQVLLEYLESSERGAPPDTAEWLARHPEFASDLQEFLQTQDQVDSLTKPVRQLCRELRQTVLSSPEPLPAAVPVPPPAGPARSARQFNPETRRFADELAGLLHGRLLAGNAIGAVAFAVMVLVGLASPHGRHDYPSLALYTSMTVAYAALVAWLLRFRDAPLSRLRVVEVLSLAPYAAHSAWKDYQHYSQYWETLAADDQWFLVSHSCLNWVFLIVVYGVMIPNSWRRSLRMLAGIALIPLAVYAATWLSFPESRHPVRPLFDLFAMARVMAAAVAISVFGAHKFSTLRREAYEARHLGNYRVQRRLAAGGMGEVYLAEHRSLNRPYAVKLIRPEAAADPTSRTRFEREIQAMARLTHWNTIEIIDYGHAPDGTFYYVMEYVEGLNLRELVDLHGPLHPGRVVYLLRQVCAALAEAHARGIIHRDIKPGNIMLTQQAGLADAVKVLDFGLVQIVSPSDGDDKLTRTGMVVGTPGYIAPEQAAGVTDVRSDIYSLGAVGYFLLSGQTPFGGRQADRLVSSPGLEPTPLRELSPDVPADLEAVIQRCLRRQPAERYADVQMLDGALAACDCATSWGPSEAAAWWRANPAPVTAGAGRPDEAVPDSGSTPPRSIGESNGTG